jgi:hypothetical protein
MEKKNEERKKLSLANSILVDTFYIPGILFFTLGKRWAHELEKYISLSSFFSKTNRKYVGFFSCKN